MLLMKYSQIVDSQSSSADFGVRDILSGRGEVHTSPHVSLLSDRYHPNNIY